MSETLLMGEAGTNASQIWRLDPASYGNPVTGSAPLYTESPDSEPIPGAQVTVRRIFLPIAYKGDCTIRVTPIVDFDTELAPTTKSFSQPAKRKRAVIEAKAAKLCTYIRVRVEVLSCTGRVEVFTPRLGILPVSKMAETIAGPD